MEEKNKKKRIKFIIISILLLFLIAISIFVIYKFIILKNDDNRLYIYELNDYSISVSEYKLTKQELEDSDLKEVGSYKAKGNNVKYYSYGTNCIVLKDNNEYYVYDYVKNIKHQLFLGDKEIEDIQIVTNNDDALGVIVTINNECTYYSLNSNKYLYSFDYWSPDCVGNTVYISYYVESKENNLYTELGVFNALTGEKILETSLNNQEYEEGYVFIPLTDENNNIKYWALSSISGEAIQIYNEQKELILNHIKSINYDTGKGNIVLSSTDNKSFNIYNSNGKLLKTSSKYEEVYKIFKDYVIVLDKSNLNLIDYDGNIVENLIKWDSNRYTFYTGYTEYIKETGRPYEIHVIIVDSKVEPGEEGCALDYIYNLNTKKLEIKKLSEF